MRDPVREPPSLPPIIAPITRGRWLTVLLAALLGTLVTGAGCARPTEIRTAPFRARPDSVAAGDLRGPYSGRVTDAATGSAVAGALVYATWAFERGYGLAAPAGFRKHVVSTDATGTYRIPSVADVPGGIPSGTRLTEFHLVIYKRGFVAYRSDRRFVDFGPRLDFAQEGLDVPLERWRADYSHARHVRYVGGGPELTGLTAWEVDEAVAELSGDRRGVPDTELVATGGGGPYLVAAQLLTDADIKDVTRFDGGFETGPLGDEPDTTTYSSQHFKAMGRAESFDVALRMWRLDPGAAQEQYDDLLTTLPGAEERDEIANRSLRANERDIRGIAFLDGQRGLVVLLTCGKNQCTSSDHAAALGQKVHGRIKALWPVAATAPVDAPDVDAPAETAPEPTP